MRTAPTPARRRGEPLRVALLAYRGNPFCGGQGVYVRHLARELAALGHEVTVLAGQPYPRLDDGARLERVPSLDLYREPDPFRRPRARELTSLVDLLELATMWSGGFAEPRAFSLRVRDALAPRRSEFDLVHDNQCLGPGLRDLAAAGWAVLASVHHPVSVDRALDLAHAQDWRRALGLRRWYGFTRTQARVARALPRIVTVSRRAATDITDEMGVAPDRISVVPVGVDATVFRPLPGVARVPGRIMTTASADVPLKGLGYLLGALAKLRTKVPEAHLVVIGRARPEGEAARTIERFGLEAHVRFLQGVSDDTIVREYARASCAVVPSLYEGFSLPAIEAMACSVPLVATTGGALPEVVGESGRAALLAPPADADALAAQLREVLRAPELAGRLGATGRSRALERFTWGATAAGCVEVYEELLDRSRC